MSTPRPSPDLDLSVQDLGPLAWVMDELRKSLDGAIMAFRRFVREAEQARGTGLETVDASHLRVARQQVYQSVGALEMVGQDTPAQILRALESLAQHFIAKPETCSAEAVAKVEKAGFALIEYLDAVIAGRPVSPLSLFPQYRDILLLAGADRVHPADLWAMPWRWVQPALADGEARSYEAGVRNRFEHSVLKLVKNADLSAARTLADLSLGLARSQKALQPRVFWQIAAGFFEALAAGLAPLDVYAKRAVSRVLQQYGALSKGELGVSDRLAQDLLFFCAQAVPPRAVEWLALSAVRSAYELAQHRPADYSAEQFGRYDPALLVQARKRVAAAKESWSALSGGEVSKLKATTDAFSSLADALHKLLPSSETLARELSESLQSTQYANAVPSPAMAMEVATAVLYVEAVLEELDPSDPQLSARMMRLTERLRRARAGVEPEPLEPWMEELYRRVSDRQTMGSVVGELRGSLSELEKSLDAFFRNPADKSLLQPVPGQFAQMRGVLSVLGLDQASSAVQFMRDRVEEMLVTEVDADQARKAGTFETLGNSLGALGFMIDMLSYQPALARKLFVFDEATGELKPLMGRSADRLMDALAAVTLSEDLLDGAAADGAGGEAGTVQQLEALAVQAGLADQPALERAALKAAEAAASGRFDATTAFQAVLPGRASEPLVQPASVAPMDLQEDDLLGIFLEEGREVVVTARDAVQALEQAPDDMAVQATLRRAYHTLKGSSRMVGLDDFGEGAWALEQVFNAWLPEQKPATPELLELARATIEGFSGWLDSLAAGSAEGWSSQPFRDAAQAFRDGRPLQPVGPRSDSGDEADDGPTPSEWAALAAVVDQPESRAAELAAEHGASVPLADFDIVTPAQAAARDGVPMPEFVSTQIDLSSAQQALDQSTGTDAAPMIADLDLDSLGALSRKARDEAAGREVDPEILSEDSSAVEDLAELRRALQASRHADLEEPADAADVTDSLLPDHGEAVERPVFEATEVVPIDSLLPEFGPTEIGFPAGAPPSFEATEIGRPPDFFAPTEVGLSPEFAPTQPPVLDSVRPEPAEAPPLLGDTEFDFAALFTGGSPTPGARPAPTDAPPERRQIEPVPGEPVVDSLLPDFDWPAQAPAARADGSGTAADAQTAQPPAAGGALGDDQSKVIGDLRIPIPLYNVYLNEADEWSRRLAQDLGEWAMELHQPLPDAAVAMAHSLAGASATVGFSGLSGLARALEHAMLHVQPRALGDAGHAAVFVEAAEDIRRLLHQFAAGFLKEPQEGLLERLKEVADSPLPDSQRMSLDPASAPTPLADAAQLVAPAARVVMADVQLDDDLDIEDALDADLFPVFEDEAVELMPRLAGALRQWVARPDNAGARAEVLRNLHTLKGSARLAGALRLGEMTHRMESVIERMEAEGLQSAQIDPLLGQFDQLSATFESVRSVDLSESRVMPAAAAEVHADHARQVVPSEAPAWAGGEVAPDMAETASGTPPAGVDADGTSLPVGTVSGPDTPQAVPAVTAVPARMRAQAVPSAPLQRAGVQSQVRVRSQLLDRLVNQAGEVMMTRSRLEATLGQLRGSLSDLTGNLDRLRQQLRDVELQAETQMQSRLAQSRDRAGFDPLEFDRFTRMQELTRMMAESVNDVATVQRTLQRSVETTEDTLVAQARQTRELQRDLLKTRMVEFEGVAERLYRVVRQAGKDAGKSVRLDITGGSIEIDRGVLDRVTPAFEHILRNGVAHGIERPEERVAAGKEAAGVIAVAVQQDGNDVSVIFRDDGAGLNLPRIRGKAESLGLLSPDAQPTDDELAQFIFHPGFSTAYEVTELAGRGIGMDVVRSEVNALGGRVELHSRPGAGTEFRLVLPLTTAVTQVVMVRCGSLSFGVPANIVEVVRRLPAAELAQAYALHSLPDSAGDVPFFWSGALLQSSPRSVEPQARTSPVVVLRSAAQRVAMHVDEVLGNQEVVVKNLGPQLSRLPGLTGMSVLPSGAVVLIYNPVALATVYGAMARELTVAAESASPEPTPDGAGVPDVPVAPTAPRVPLVMVVDDSITVRRVTQRLLQREGYRVVLAADGLQALEKLRDERPQVVLSDIEMPRMDGFDLVRNLRADSNLQQLPVIMITSRIAEKHREHARSLGVDHYLGKPYAEDELLRLVAHYCADFFTTA